MSYATSRTTPLRRVNLRRHLEQGPLIGTFQLMVGPAVTELLCLAGADMVCLDAEHAAFDLGTAEHHVRAAEAAGGSAIIRVSTVSSILSRALDLGACGVIVPGVATAEEVRRVVDYVRFPPAGSRGVGAARAARFGMSIDEYRAFANVDILLVVMVETRHALENVDEIVSVEGVDVIMVGPTDLASSLEVEPGSAEHTSAVDKILRTTLAAGKFAGIHCANAAQVAEYHAKGARFFLVGFDSAMLVDAAGQAFSAARDATGSTAPPPA